MHKGLIVLAMLAQLAGCTRESSTSTPVERAALEGVKCAVAGKTLATCVSQTPGLSGEARTAMRWGWEQLQHRQASSAPACVADLAPMSASETAQAAKFVKHSSTPRQEPLREATMKRGVAPVPLLLPELSETRPRPAKLTLPVKPRQQAARGSKQSAERSSTAASKRAKGSQSDSAARRPAVQAAHASDPAVKPAVEIPVNEARTEDEPVYQAHVLTPELAKRFAKKEATTETN